MEAVQLRLYNEPLQPPAGRGEEGAEAPSEGRSPSRDFPEKCVGQSPKMDIAKKLQTLMAQGLTDNYVLRNGIKFLVQEIMAHPQTYKKYVPQYSKSTIQKHNKKLRDIAKKHNRPYRPITADDLEKPFDLSNLGDCGNAIGVLSDVHKHVDKVTMSHIAHCHSANGCPVCTRIKQMEEQLNVLAVVAFFQAQNSYYAYECQQAGLPAPTDKQGKPIAAVKPPTDAYIAAHPYGTAGYMPPYKVREQSYLTMLTLTAPHDAHTSLTNYRHQMTDALRFLRKDYPVIVEYLQHVRGRIRTTEDTLGKNGWHDHFHILLAVDAHLAGELDKFEAAVAKNWHLACCRAGIADKQDKKTERHMLEHGAHVSQEFDPLYVAKMGDWSPVDELTMSTSKTGKLGKGRNFNEVVRDYYLGLLNPATTKTQERTAFNRIAEYLLAKKGAHAVQWSQGLKRLVGLVSDDGGEKQEQDEGQYICTLSKMHIAFLRRHCLEREFRHLVARLAPEGGLETVQAWFDALDSDLLPVLDAEKADIVRRDAEFFKLEQSRLERELSLLDYHDIDGRTDIRQQMAALRADHKMWLSYHMPSHAPDAWQSYVGNKATRREQRREQERRERQDVRVAELRRIADAQLGRRLTAEEERREAARLEREWLEAVAQGMPLQGAPVGNSYQCA